MRCHRNNDRPVCRIAVAAGGGNMTSDMRAAVELGCDTYVTGEYAVFTAICRILRDESLCGKSYQYGNFGREVYGGAVDLRRQNRVNQNQGTK